MGDPITLFPTEPHERRATPGPSGTGSRWQRPARSARSATIRIEQHREMIYRHHPRSIICRRCADKQGIDLSTAQALAGT